MNRLLKLFADNRAANKTPRAQPRLVAEGDEATLYLYEAIVADDATAEWWGGVSAQSLVPQIRAIAAKTLHLRINSPGGDVFAAQAIAQAIRDTKAHVVAHIDGYAASAATQIAIAADEIEIAEGGFFMIHNAWTLAVGNASDLAATVVLLNKVDDVLCNAYAVKCGKSSDEVKAWMDAETWFAAQEAVDAGLVDRIADGAKAKASAWNLAAYDQAPAPADADDAALQAHRDRQAQRLSVICRASPIV